MTAEVLSPLFVGPAVVVDDKVDIDDSDVQAILAQIEQANVPLLKLKALPDLAEVRHWAGFSMIVLDWELFSDAATAEIDGEDNADSDLAPPSGVMLPDSVHTENDERAGTFVRELLDKIYAPIFIVSNLGAEEIHSRLRTQLGDDPRLATRVLVRGKGDVQTGLWNDFDEWVKEHPAVYALKAWEVCHEAAKHRFFADLEQMSPSWPGILWQTFALDSVNQHFELAETLNRNILHRMEPILFDGDAIVKPSEGAFDRESLHKVLHGQAAVPGSQLPSDMVMQGDLYFAPTEDGTPPEEILINLSAECDLVPRNGDLLEDLPVRIVTARLKSAPTSKNKLKELRWTDGTSAIIHLLTPYGRPYEVQFSSHHEVKFKEIPFPRQGRLLPPYLTQLFQSFALYLLRPGLPRLPMEFYLDGESEGVQKN